MAKLCDFLLGGVCFQIFASAQVQTVVLISIVLQHFAAKHHSMQWILAEHTTTSHFDCFFMWRFYVCFSVSKRSDSPWGEFCQQQQTPMS
jgi:hypothetical protein